MKIAMFVVWIACKRTCRRLSCDGNYFMTHFSNTTVVLWTIIALIYVVYWFDLCNNMHECNIVELSIKILYLKRLYSVTQLIEVCHNMKMLPCLVSCDIHVHCYLSWHNVRSMLCNFRLKHAHIVSWLPERCMMYWQTNRQRYVLSISMLNYYIWWRH